MNKKDKAETIRRYEKRLKEFGISCQTLGWNGKESQYLRFMIMSEISDLNNVSILDVGCGFGDFYYYLKKRGINVTYTGYDISSKIIECAKQKFSKFQVEFQVKDILLDNVDRRFDYVFSSGIFNAKISDNISFVKKMMKKMFEMCNIGIAVNMLTNYVDYMRKDLFYYSPQEMLEFSKTLSKYVTLRHDYPLYEFTIYIYKRNKYSKEE